MHTSADERHQMTTTKSSQEMLPGEIKMLNIKEHITP